MLRAVQSTALVVVAGIAGYAVTSALLALAGR